MSQSLLMQSAGFAGGSGDDANDLFGHCQAHKLSAYYPGDGTSTCQLNLDDKTSPTSWTVKTNAAAGDTSRTGLAIFTSGAYNTNQALIRYLYPSSTYDVTMTCLIAKSSAATLNGYVAVKYANDQYTFTCSGVSVSHAYVSYGGTGYFVVAVP